MGKVNYFLSYDKTRGKRTNEFNEQSKAIANTGSFSESVNQVTFLSTTCCHGGG